MKRIINCLFLLICGVIIGNVATGHLPDVPWSYNENVPEPVKLLVEGVEREVVDRIDSAISHALAPPIGTDNQLPDTGSNFKQNVGIRVKQAGEQIEEPEFNGFYGQLVEGMNPAFDEVNSEKGFVANQLPDVEVIYGQSLTLPLQAAEADIETPQLRHFYRRLMSQSGLE